MSMALVSPLEGGLVAVSLDGVIAGDREGLWEKKVGLRAPHASVVIASLDQSCCR